MEVFLFLKIVLYDIIKKKRW